MVSEVSPFSIIISPVVSFEFHALFSSYTSFNTVLVLILAPFSPSLLIKTLQFLIFKFNTYHILEAHYNAIYQDWCIYVWSVCNLGVNGPYDFWKIKEEKEIMHQEATTIAILILLAQTIVDSDWHYLNSTRAKFQSLRVNY